MRPLFVCLFILFNLEGFSYAHRTPLYDTRIYLYTFFIFWSVFMLFLATMQPQMDLAKLKKDPCQIDSKLHHVFNATENHLTWLAHSE